MVHLTNRNLVIYVIIFQVLRIIHGVSTVKKSHGNFENYFVIYYNMAKRKSMNLRARHAGELCTLQRY